MDKTKINKALRRISEAARLAGRIPGLKVLINTHRTAEDIRELLIEALNALNEELHNAD